MIVFKIPVPASSIKTSLNYGIANVSIITNGVSFVADGSTVISDYSTTFPNGNNSGGGGGTGANGATGPIGATGPAGPPGPTTSIIFDGGWPDQSYATGPAFDCGGIT
jgi:hypothetical protein